MTQPRASHAVAGTHEEAPVLRRTRLPDQIASQLVRQIVEGDLAAGTPLPTEAELVSEYSVGKSAVREAVRIVSTKGLVEVVQGSGMRVAPRRRWNLIDTELLSVFDGGISIGNLMEMRVALEPSIAAHAADRASPEDIDRLEALVEETSAHLDDTEGIVRRDLDFHNVLAEAAGNPLYTIVLNSVAELQVELRRKVVSTAQGRDHGIDYHTRIVEALRERDPAGARDLMVAHLDAVNEDLGLVAERP